VPLIAEGEGVSVEVVGLAHGEAVAAVVVAKPVGKGDGLVLVVGTVVSLVDRSRDDVELRGTGEEPVLLESHLAISRCNHPLVRPSLVAVAGEPAAGLAPLLRNFLLTLTLENFLAPARPDPAVRGGVEVRDNGVGGRMADEEIDTVCTRGEPSVSVCSCDPCSSLSALPFPSWSETSTGSFPALSDGLTFPSTSSFFSGLDSS